uniref:Large ribosomal subunit protein mL51 n=1 Tax=Panagrolaimus sp. PS1159 TaxID=55785 RepID=A0AC35FHW1_9BILA
MLSQVSQLSRLSLQPCSAAISFTRTFNDNSQVPRVADDRMKKMFKPTDTGYYYRYHRQGIDKLPRIADCKEPVARPKFKIRESWAQHQARFGENDYIDLLGNGSVHPAQLQYHVPRWLRGFPGQHRANELIKLIHYRNLHKEKMQANAPHQWHQLCKRIKYLLQYHNYRKQDEMHEERNLGLWEEEPDYFYKDKSRRSYKDLV